MAKTRLQAKYHVDDESVVELVDISINTPLSPTKKKDKYSGAVDVLRQTYAEKGFAGWYQVRSPLYLESGWRKVEEFELTLDLVLGCFELK